LHLSPPAFFKDGFTPTQRMLGRVFLLSFGLGSALDQVQKININQSVKKAFAGLST
jgi:hypothetical protein